MGNSPFTFESQEWEKRFNFVPVDNWLPLPMNIQDNIYEQDTIFTTNKGAIIAPISWFYDGPNSGVGNNDIDFFVTSTKKCYNSVQMRNHTCKYLNYFERFYDTDKEYFAILANMKWLMDYNIEYNKHAFLYDIKRYILSPTILQKTFEMSNDNYTLKLAYKNITNPSLQYTDENAISLMQMSILMNLCIPLLTHFAYTRKITDIDDFLLEVFDEIFYKFDDTVDMYSKIYETSTTNISRNEKNNKPIWAKQDIRGKNVTTHSMSSAENIILNIMPKYLFSENIISLNYTSINNNTAFQVVEIEYEFSYISLSSSKRDEDSVSEFDKFESSLVKQSEALYLQNKINSFETMNRIDYLFGPFDENEIKYYSKQLNTDYTINSFQQKLIFNLFFKYFGDTVSTYAINKIDYVKLLIVARKMLLSNGMILLPYVISGKVEKLIGRKTINKKELTKMESSPNYKLVVEKYKNEKIIKQILSIIATIISSEFKIIDLSNSEIDGKPIEIIPEIIIEEVLIYTLLI